MVKVLTIGYRRAQRNLFVRVLSTNHRTGRKIMWIGQYDNGLMNIAHGSTEFAINFILFYEKIYAITL